MADVKWIKIVTDIFDDEKILLIESMPEADAIIVIWFKLLCLAGKQNNGGVFMLNERIAYTEEMFATIFRRKVTTVRMALKTFEQFGMVEIINDTVTIPNWSKHQSLDAYEKRKEYDRQYSAERRKRQRLLLQESSDPSPDASSDQSVVESSDPSPDVGPLDKEEDKDIDRDKNKKKNTTGTEPFAKGTGPTAKAPPVFEIPCNDGSMYPVYQDQVDAWQKLYPAVNVPQEIRKMIGWSDAKPGNRKTKRGMKSFIVNWLSREQDKGGVNRPVYGRRANPPADYSGEWDPTKDW